MTSEDRCNEEVRPIFWAVKPKSYVSQTQTWDDFPNGRWGLSASPAFTLSEDDSYQYFTKKQAADPESRRKIWGHEVTSMRVICDVFTKFVS